MWVAAVAHAQAHAPAGLEATAHTLCVNLYSTIGIGAGSVLWSWIYSITGAKMVYRLGALATLALIIVTVRGGSGVGVGAAALPTRR